MTCECGLCLKLRDEVGRLTEKVRALEASQTPQTSIPAIQTANRAMAPKPASDAQDGSAKAHEHAWTDQAPFICQTCGLVNQ